jgi:flagellar basal-body rod protein FlgB
MKMNGIFDKTFSGLEKALDLTWRRNEAITSNITNADTPGYRATDLNFAGELRRAFAQQPTEVSKTDTSHMDLSSGEEAHLEADLAGATKADGNNVDIDIQMSELAFNSGQYSGASRLLRKKLGIIKMAIREGSR